MHQYSIDSKARKIALCVILFTSLFLSVLIRNLLSDFFSGVYNSLTEIKKIRKAVELISDMELMSSLISFSAFFALLSFLYNNYLWKTKLFCKISGVPNLNGFWNGKIIAYRDNQEYKMRLKIEQTWNEIRCTSYFEKSQSFSNIAAVYSHGNEGDTLYFGFCNTSGEVQCGFQKYDGYNILHLKGDTLEGRYMNDRTSIGGKGGNIGSIFLEKEN